MNSSTKISAFVHQKGGTGKTTACLNIAGCLVKQHQKVLVVDLDPQCSATSGLGLNRDQDVSVYQVLMNEVDIKQSILETESGIYVIPGAIDLLTIERRLGHSKSQVQRLKTHLQRVANYFDVILIDTPAGYTSLIVNAVIAASGNIIIPLDSGVFSYESLEIFYMFLNELAKTYQISIHFMAVLHREEVPSPPPKRPASNLLTKMGQFWQTTAKSESTFLYTPESALQTFWEQTGMEPVKIYHLPHSPEVIQSQINGVPISHYASHSNIAQIYQQITNELYL